MKPFPLIVLAFIMVTCSHRDEPLTDELKQQIIAEVKTRTDQIIAGSEAVDMKLAHEPYLNSEEFIHMSKGRNTDFVGFMESNRKYFESVDSQKFVSTFEKFTVVNEETVIANWSGKIVAKRSDGQQGGTDPFGVTLVFAKREGKWQVINSHESW